jgi:HD-like signal output (HDOD) protein
MPKVILFVDDEVQILKSLKRLFRGSGYEVYFADSGAMAIDILTNNRVDLVVTDIRMPEMDGFELLKHIKEDYPLTLRVALSGFTDNRKIFDALENNLAKLYMFKPWDNSELLATIDKIFELEDVLLDQDLLDMINNLDEIPSIPFLYREISKLVEEDASIEDIAAKIEQDQSIASKVLKVANSAFYGAKTGSINQAIMYIGLINVKNIVLTNSVFNNFGEKSKYHELLWKHVNLTNKFVNVIYQRCLNKRLPNVYASAGLLHDIGRILLIRFFTERYKELMVRLDAGEGKTMSNLESELIGFDHQQVGGYLLSWWEIPVPIVEAALYHHDPLNEAIINRELVQVVHLANYYSWLALEEEYFREGLHVEVFNELGLNREVVEAEIERCQQG